MIMRWNWLVAIACICAISLSACRRDDGVVSPVNSPEPPPPSPVVSPTPTVNAPAKPDPVSALQDTRWQLVSLEGEQLAENTYITLEIGSEGSTGELVCNSYGFFATFADDGTIQTSALLESGGS